MKNKNAGIEYAYLNYGRYYDRYFNMFIKLVNGRFRYFNLPNEIPAENIERFLTQYGQILLFRVVGNKFGAYNFTSLGNIDIYGYPLKRMVTFANGKRLRFNNTNSVIIYNNSMHTPDLLTISSYSAQLAQLDEAIDVNLRSCKTPIIFKGNKKQLQSMQKIYNRIDNNDPALFVYSDNNLIDNIEVLDLKATYRGNEFYQTKKNLLEEAFKILGFYIPNEKAERLIIDEVAANNSITDAARYDMLKMRQKGLKIFNDMFKDFLPEPVYVDYSGDGKEGLN